MVKLQSVIEELELQVYCCEDKTDRLVQGVYCGDLMSDVLANAAAGMLWITVQMHPNIAAVASLKDLSAIVLSNGRSPQPETIEKAKGENIPILGSPLGTFELAAKLSELLAGSADHAKAPAG